MLHAHRGVIVGLALVALCPRSGGAACTLRDLAPRAGIHVGAALVEGRQFPEYRPTLSREMTQNALREQDLAHHLPAVAIAAPYRLRS